MKTIVVRYQVKPDHAPENQRYVGQVMAELAGVRPEGVDYRVYQLDDGVSFMHVATYADGADSSAITSLASFQEFQKTLPQRVAAPPSGQDATLVGSFTPGR
ncbi:MAG: hypothetical protein JOZ39_06855 [Chloroflexi bacterium]|nr:hypothetical protein [Chloroflexota bacterium]